MNCQVKYYVNAATGFLPGWRGGRGGFAAIDNHAGRTFVNQWHILSPISVFGVIVSLLAKDFAVLVEHAVRV